MKKTLLTLALLILVNIYCYGNKIYTWVDQAGVTHFSDTNNGNQGAVAISDSPKSIIKSSNNHSQNENQNKVNSNQVTKMQTANINISISKPISNETFQNTRSQPINVILSGFQEVFNNSGYIELSVDNKINRTFSSGNTFYILSPDRGKHILQATAYTQNGEKTSESQQVIFYIQDQTAKNTAGSTVINNQIYQNQATPINYNNFQQRNNDQLVNPKLYNNGFKPTSKAYIQQVTGNGN